MIPNWGEASDLMMRPLLIVKTGMINDAVFSLESGKDSETP